MQENHCLCREQSQIAWEATTQKKRIYNTDLSGMLFHHRPINTSISSISASSSNVSSQVVRNIS